MTVVRTGPDPERLRRGAADPALRRGRRFLAAYIGVMGPQDGVDIVVRAADIVVHELGRDDIAFTLIGSGDCFDELVALRDELGLAGHVEFTGRAPDELVARILSTADVGLSPDPKNPLNDLSTMNKSMEYMAFELPVVAFDLRETRVSVGDAGGLRQAERRARVRRGDRRAPGRRADAGPPGQAGTGPGRAGAGLVPPGAGLPGRLPAADRSAPRLSSPDAEAEMCGIAGCYQQADGQKLVGHHDRPDRAPGPGRERDSGAHEDDRVSVQLGHRRLSIIDLSAAADQPLSKHGLTLVYNGELYNYKELRAELASRGVSFVTTSDTEVVLEAWRHWGPEALRRFRGMFAFALADEATGDLVLARDPLGIKPLYYLPRGDGVLFASELKALVAAVGTELRIEPGALVASMLYYWVPEQYCAIEGVQKLPAGSWARFRPDGRSHLEHYWRIAEVARGGRRDPRSTWAR